MQAHSRWSRRWRRFNHKYGSLMGLGFVVLCILAFVIGLMFLLTDVNCRARF